MATETRIGWATSTFNPWIGCSKAGPGCDGCYAEEMMATRWKRVEWGPGKPRQRTSEANWREPLKWNARRAAAIARGENPPQHRVFCASLADVFDNEVPDEWRADLFELIKATPHLTWLLLTKRIGNVGNMLPLPFDFAENYPNVWIGATVVNQKEADRDIPKLLQVDAVKRFLSIEPMLGPVDLLANGDTLCRCDGCLNMARQYPQETGLQRIDWVIAGGESGPKARPAHPDWIRSLRDQCAAAGVPFFFKQWGEWAPGECVERDNGTVLTATYWNDALAEWAIAKENLAADDGRADDQPDLYRIGAKAAGNTLDGRKHEEFPT